MLAALTCQLAHYAGHAYQIVFLAKHLTGDQWFSKVDQHDVQAAGLQLREAGGWNGYSAFDRTHLHDIAGPHDHLV